MAVPVLSGINRYRVATACQHFHSDADFLSNLTTLNQWGCLRNGITPFFFVNPFDADLNSKSHKRKVDNPQYY